VYLKTEQGTISPIVSQQCAVAQTCYFLQLALQNNKCFCLTLGRYGVKMFHYNEIRGSSGEWVE